MHASRRLPVLVLAAGLFVAACSASGGSPVPSAAPPAPSVAPQTSASSATGTLTVGTASTATLGTFLTGPDGRTLYTHGGDSVNVSTCTGGCLSAWPPFTVTAGQQLVAGAGVTGKLGTFTRPEGTIQVTYNGLPLYTWPGDAKPGQTTGQGVGGFTVAAVAGSAPSPTKTGGYTY